MLLLLVIALGVACGHPRQARVTASPPPPPPGLPRQPQPNSSTPSENPYRKNLNAELAEPTLPAGAKVLATETGLASWYGPPYHNRRGSNGEVYNMNAMTAAHRTYPLGSIVRVTNLKTGHFALVRITDRGPFIPGRILDLSLAAAHKVDVYQPGVAEVRVELMESPAPATRAENGRCRSADSLTSPSPPNSPITSPAAIAPPKFCCFSSPAGDWWIRIRVLDDDRKRAQELAAETETPEGAVFVVRLD